MDQMSPFSSDLWFSGLAIHWNHSGGVLKSLLILGSTLNQLNYNIQVKGQGVSIFKSATGDSSTWQGQETLTPNKEEPGKEMGWTSAMLGWCTEFSGPHHTL